MIKWRRTRAASFKIAVAITRGMSSMWAVYLFVLWCFIPIMYRPASTFAQYVAGCVQLVALPLIMVGQRLMGKRAERRAEEDHKNIMQTLTEIRNLERSIKLILTKYHSEEK